MFKGEEGCPDEFPADQAQRAARMILEFVNNSNPISDHEILQDAAQLRSLGHLSTSMVTTPHENNLASLPPVLTREYIMA